METKAPTFVFMLLTNWVFLRAVQVDAVSNPLQQCGCVGDLSLPKSSPDQTRTEIVLTAFFSFRDCYGNNTIKAGSTTTYHLIPAALLAIEEINNSSDILTSFFVSLDIRDTQCDGAQGKYQLIQSIKPRVGRNVDPPDNSLNLAIMGPGCSAVSQSVAGVAGRWLNISQVSYGYNLPALANRDKFPSFFQTARSIDLTTMSAHSLLSHLNWTNRIAMIYEVSDLFNLAIERFVRLSDTTSGFEFRNNEITIPITKFAQVVPDTKSADQAVIGVFMSGVVQDKIRVIVGFVSERIASLLLCMTRNVATPSDGFLFVFVGSLNEDWWKDNTFCHLKSSEVESVIIVSSESIVSNSSTVLHSGRTVHDFKVDYSSRLSSWCSLTYDSLDPLAATTYDAVWSIANALNSITDLLNVSNTDRYQYSSAIYEAVQTSLHATNFTGVSGQVQFNEKGERIGVDTVLQMQNGKLEIVGKFKPNNEGFIEGKFHWFGSTADPPSDTPTIINKAVPLYILIISMVFTFTGIIFSCVMCCFNLNYAKHKVLLASSQKLNYVIIVGTFFAYVTVVLLTVLESPLGHLMSENLFEAICVIRIWILPLSFTLSYGTMFAKAWRIYRIFNDPWTSKRPLRDYHLMIIVAGLGFVDILYLVPWTIMDPYRRFSAQDETNFEEFSRCSFVSCSSSNLLVWLGILTAYKVVVMLAGVLVISLVRKNVSKKKIFDDSRSLAAALYITALSFIIGVLFQLLFTFQQRITLAYISSAVWVNIASSGTLTSVFMPKVYRIIVKHGRGKKYQTPRSIFYLQHPEFQRSVSLGSLSVGSLTDLNNANQTVVCDIKEDTATTK